MKQEPVIDVEFSEVGKEKGPSWYETPYLVEELMRLLCGTALLGFAGYCVHEFLVFNFG